MNNLIWGFNLKIQSNLICFYIIINRNIGFNFDINCNLKYVHNIILRNLAEMKIDQFDNIIYEKTT